MTRVEMSSSGLDLHVAAFDGAGSPRGKLGLTASFTGELRAGDLV